MIPHRIETERVPDVGASTTVPTVKDTTISFIARLDCVISSEAART